MHGSLDEINVSIRNLNEVPNANHAPNVINVGLIIWGYHAVLLEILDFAPHSTLGKTLQFGHKNDQI